MSKEMVKNFESECFIACVCRRLQSTVYANWQAIQGNNQPQARNESDGEAAADRLVYASIVFGPVKMQQMWDDFFKQQQIHNQNGSYKKKNKKSVNVE